MFNIRIHCILFTLCLQKKEEEEEERKMNKPKFSCWVFSTLLKVSGTFKSRFSIRIAKGYCLYAFALVCFVFLGAAPILYVQAAKLNLTHP